MNRKFFTFILPLLIILINTFVSDSFAQKSASVDPSLDKRGNEYMNRQSEAFLKEIKHTMSQFPPQYPLPREREMSLLLFDAVMHDKYAAHRQPVQEFYNIQISHALEDIRKTKVEEGVKIWKLYNMSFIIRTSSVTLAFDLTSGESAGADGFTIPDDIMHQIIDECDVLFISHRHRDHADSSIAYAFINQQKPVVAPSQVWEDQAIHSSITHLKREAHTLQTLPIENGREELKVVIYPGNQMRSHRNNVPLVITPEGYSISHMGDQINEGNFMIDYEWIDVVKNHHKVDILIPPCWTNEIHRIVQGFDPELVIPGHENELGHPVDDRVPYWGDSEYLELTYPELKKSDYPLVLMVWGESYHYVRGE
jgi:L-ascorbate metabolism protein UlaG (beta-lactamase superfamily)